MQRSNLSRPRWPPARLVLWGAAVALGCATARAQDIDPNAIAVAFTGGDMSGGPGVVSNVRLNLEVTDEQIAQSSGFRSMSLTVDVDCPGGRERIRKAEAFDRPNLAGAPSARPASGEWGAPAASLREVVKTVCTTHGLRFVEQAGGALAVASIPVPPPPRPAASAPEPAAGTTASPAPAPEPQPDAAPATLATTPPAAPSRRVALGKFSAAETRVQIASSPSRAEAEAMLSRSAALIAPPLRGEVEVASVRGRTVYRSIIAPFASEADARAFCARTGVTLDGCFVWKAR